MIKHGAMNTIEDVLKRYVELKSILDKKKNIYGSLCTYMQNIEHKRLAVDGEGAWQHSLHEWVEDYFKRKEEFYERISMIALVAQERMESLYAERESFIPSVNTDAGKEAFNDYISFEVAKLRMEVVACELYDFLALFGTVSWDLRRWYKNWEKQLEPHPLELKQMGLPFFIE